jgi:hypothetical protein
MCKLCSVNVMSFLLQKNHVVSLGLLETLSKHFILFIFKYIVTIIEVIENKNNYIQMYKSNCSKSNKY